MLNMISLLGYACLAVAGRIPDSPRWFSNVGKRFPNGVTRFSKKTKRLSNVHPPVEGIFVNPVYQSTYDEFRGRGIKLLGLPDWYFVSLSQNLEKREKTYQNYFTAYFTTCEWCIRCYYIEIYDWICACPWEFVEDGKSIIDIVNKIVELCCNMHYNLGCHQDRLRGRSINLASSYSGSREVLGRLKELIGIYSEKLRMDTDTFDVVMVILNEAIDQLNDVYAIVATL